MRPVLVLNGADDGGEAPMGTEDFMIDDGAAAEPAPSKRSKLVAKA
jgi:hypothetical protein